MDHAEDQISWEFLRAQKAKEARWRWGSRQAAVTKSLGRPAKRHEFYPTAL